MTDPFKAIENWTPKPECCENPESCDHSEDEAFPGRPIVGVPMGFDVWFAHQMKVREFGESLVSGEARLATNDDGTVKFHND